jgi:hypothetical protein
MKQKANKENPSSGMKNYGIQNLKAKIMKK